MSNSKRKLNPGITEFILFGCNGQRDSLKACFSIDILGSHVCVSVKNLYVWFKLCTSDASGGF